MATPKNKTNLSGDFYTSSERIVWEGPNIPCIDLCTGEKVSSVVAKVGDKLCTLVDDIEELKTLDYDCIVNKLGYTGALLNPENFSLKLLFQVLIDNDCKLKTLIDSVNASTGEGIDLTGLNLKCVTTEMLNLCGQIPAVLDVEKVLQAIINVLCGVIDEVASLFISVITLQAKIDALGTPDHDCPVVELATCLPNPLDPTNPLLPLHDHVSAVTDDAICKLNTLVGTPNDLINLLGAQCLGDYVADEHIIHSAANIAQAAYNKEVVLCDLLERISNIETNCCSAECNDIFIGFLQSYDEGTDTYTLTFSYGAGTDIPLVFTDCGSTFTITDWKGVKKIVNNAAGTLTNGAVFTINMAGSGLDLSQPMNIKISTCFTNSLSGLVCRDCFGGALDASADPDKETYWDFIIPSENVLSCAGGAANLIVYHSLYTTKYPNGIALSPNQTGTGGIPNVPNYANPNNITSVTGCGGGNLLKIGLKGQSPDYPPEIKLLISGTNLLISVIGTLSNTCQC